MAVDRTSWGSTLVKNHDENKTFILVKLSESFSNAIQEYSAPTIKFHGPRGAIKFPNGKSYDFSLEESDNAVECIKQTRNRWESVGKIARCLHVKGKDDVYQRTRTKMEAAEQEKRKYCTKLLGSPENNLTTQTSAATTTNHQNHNHHHQQPQQQQQQQQQSHNHNNSQHHHNNHHQHHNNHHSGTARTKTFDVPTTIANKSSSSSSSSNHHNHHHNNNNNNNSISITSSSSSSAHSNNNNNISNSNSSTNNNHASAVLAVSNTNEVRSSLLSSSSASSTSSSTSSYSLAAPNTPATNNNNNYVNLSKYPDITDVKQLKRYKAEFDKDFKEYQHLHGYLHRIEERFKKLRESLKQSVEGSSEWESAKEEIFNEYERVKSDSNFHRARGKYKQLYNKLAHIKEKIFQFKREHRDKCNNRKKRKR